MNLPSINSCYNYNLGRNDSFDTYDMQKTGTQLVMEAEETWKKLEMIEIKLQIVMKIARKMIDEDAAGTAAFLETKNKVNELDANMKKLLDVFYASRAN